MGHPWRATYDDVKQLRAKIESHASWIQALGGKFDSYNPKQDQERLSIYILHARTSIDVVVDALDCFEQNWNLQATEGGVRRGVKGEWTDQP